MPNFKMMEPLYLLLSKSTHPHTVTSPTRDAKLVSFEPNMFDKHYYWFQALDPALLMAIDNDDVIGTENALKKDNIKVNNLYALPSYDVPEAASPQLDTFLNRALWAQSENVFEFLLSKGANPGIKAHCNTSVLEKLFNIPATIKDTARYGRLLMNSGVSTQEIKSVASKYIGYRPYAHLIIRYAGCQPTRLAHQKVNTPAHTLGRIRV